MASCVVFQSDEVSEVLSIVGNAQENILVVELEHGSSRSSKHSRESVSFSISGCRPANELILTTSSRWSLKIVIEVSMISETSTVAPLTTSKSRTDLMECCDTSSNGVGITMMRSDMPVVKSLFFG